MTEKKSISQGIEYKWGYPLKLLVDYRGKVEVIQAKKIDKTIESDEVIIETLNSPVEGLDPSSSRRESATYRIEKENQA